MPNLCITSNNDDPLIRKASLEAIGFICEELNTTHFSQDVKNQIVLALTSNISADPAKDKIDLTLLSLKSFFHALPYAHQNFQIQNERDFIMSKLFEGFNVQDEDCQITAMQILVEIGKAEYDHVHNYFQAVCEITGKLAKCGEERVGAQAIEFWTSLAEEELRRK